MSIEMQARKKIHQTSFKYSKSLSLTHLKKEEKLIKMSNLGFFPSLFVRDFSFLDFLI